MAASYLTEEEVRTQLTTNGYVLKSVSGTTFNGKMTKETFNTNKSDYVFSSVTFVTKVTVQTKLKSKTDIDSDIARVRARIEEIRDLLNNSTGVTEAYFDNQVSAAKLYTTTSISALLDTNTDFVRSSAVTDLIKESDMVTTLQDYETPSYYTTNEGAKLTNLSNVLDDIYNTIQNEEE